MPFLPQAVSILFMLRQRGRYTSSLNLPLWNNDNASKGPLLSSASQSESRLETIRLCQDLYGVECPIIKYLLKSFPIYIPMIYHWRRQLNRNNVRGNYDAFRRWKVQNCHVSGFASWANISCYFMVVSKSKPRLSVLIYSWLE